MTEFRVAAPAYTGITTLMSCTRLLRTWTPSDDTCAA